MKTQQQTAWAFAKLALVVLGVVGVVACSVGGGPDSGGGGGGSSANIDTPLNAPTADPDKRNAEGYSEFRVVLETPFLSKEYDRRNLVFRRSDVETITQDDAEVEIRPFAETDTTYYCGDFFSNTKCVEITADVFASTTGYYGVCSAESGKCSKGVEVTVDGGDFDLSVTAFSSLDTSVLENGAIEFSATVSNDESGPGYSPESVLVYYRSVDSIIDENDLKIDGRLVDELKPGTTSVLSHDAFTPSPVGSYYFGACIEANGDINSDNDCAMMSERVSVTERDFDLSIATFSVSNSFVEKSDWITLRAKVRNASSAKHPSPIETYPYGTLKYYRSSDSTITSADTKVGSDPIHQLAAGAASDQEDYIIGHSDIGIYYYGACVDATGDSDPSNNCSASTRVNVKADIIYDGDDSDDDDEGHGGGGGIPCKSLWIFGLGWLCR